jgi:hypothetical protein
VAPALQAGVVFWRWLPGPPLVGLASTQAVKLRAFSPKTRLLLRAERPKFDSPGVQPRVTCPDYSAPPCKGDIPVTTDGGTIVDPGNQWW